MQQHDANPQSVKESVIRRLGSGGDTGRDIFVTALLASGEESGLAEMPVEAIVEHAAGAFAAIGQRQAGAARIAVRAGVAPNVDGKAAAVSIVEILNDDMPFLLDSVMGEIQARGHRVHLVLHPIFKVIRNREGGLERVTAAGDRNWSDGRQESYIRVHLEPLSPAQAQDLSVVLSEILGEVRIVVGDWKPMLERLEQGQRGLVSAAASVPPEECSEAVAFLRWLAAGNFTLLGAREFRLSGDPLTGELIPVDGAGLGILRDPSVHVLRRGTELVAMTAEVRRFFFSMAPLIITKANVQARVHRRAHMDYVGIKIFGADGTPEGELRIVGLFTSSAYTQSPRTIPLLRRKVQSVIDVSGAPPESHAGKALINVLEQFPRDELFQIATGDLGRWAAGILDLEIRPRVRAFVRTDRFDRFVSVLTYLPRDRYSSSVRERVGTYLAERFMGVLAAFYPSFADGPLVRVHFIIGRHEGVTPVVGEAEIERGLVALVRTWEDQLADTLATVEGGPELFHRYGRAFSAGYAETFSTERAHKDIQFIERLGPERPIGIDFHRNASDPPHRVHAAIYRLDQPISLSERVPVLENMGFSVIDERSFRVVPEREGGRREVAVHDMILETADGAPFPIESMDSLDVRLEECFAAVTRGAAESDSFNRLVKIAGASWREAALVRAYSAYLRQLGVASGLRYVADTLVRHPGVARDLIELFAARFDPDRALDSAAREAACLAIRTRIEAALASVENLDEDRLLRQLLALVLATVRTNFYQRDEAGEAPETIAFKMDGRALDMAPQPRSYREIFISSPRVEAVHLRFAPIARGGIRWSDRALDFRTEVLGLAKAQQVKNAVIVPAGAKGGFIPKLLPRSGSREQIQQEGIAAYRIFIGTLLDITDNIRDGAVVPPPRVIRYDGDDPYLVVAADKGTATFSDIANGISTARGFWLADAFASGGITGYDHKGIAITSRGAWECVKRHFREMDRDIQSAPFTVIGVGDMSGDVFGNAMLRSEATRLVAAFDHRDIFLDPNPDPAKSFAERRRLFNLTRSSWADYDKGLISKGGGVFARSLKAVPLSPEVRALLKIDAESITPAELMHAILKCEADLLFFGGIGTFVKAQSEMDADVGDRGNDAIRITAAELNVKVIGEGANLGMTQRGRIEAAQRGVRLNTDFIDNSAGVNCSDQEVNIKIALGPVVQSGRLSIEARNSLMKEMTGDVAAAVLRNNYQQSLALSLAERRAPGDLAASARLIRALEALGLLDRRLEGLPSDREIAERQRAGRGFVRPELAALLSYAKIALLHDLLASKVPDESFMQGLLVDYFPPALQRSYRDDLARHRLKREIIATTLTNGLVNRLGAPTPLLLADETAEPVVNVAAAFMAARHVLGLAELWRRIDGLDGQVKGAVQLDLYERVREALVKATRMFLREGGAARDLAATITVHEQAMRSLKVALAAIGPGGWRSRWQQRETQLVSDGVPADVAADVAALDVLADGPGIAIAAGRAKADVVATAAAYLAVGDRFRIGDIAEMAARMRLADDYDRLAVASALSGFDEARSRIAIAEVTKARDGVASPAGEAIVGGRRGQQVARELGAIADGAELTVARLTVAAARLSELARLPS